MIPTFLFWFIRFLFYSASDTTWLLYRNVYCVLDFVKFSPPTTCLKVCESCRFFFSFFQDDGLSLIGGGALRRMKNSWAKGPIRPNLVVPRPRSEPGAHSALTSFALNSVASTWLGANSREAVCVWEKGTLMAPEQPPTPGAQSYWLAPYLTLWGAPIIPQELVPHLITVGNTWPFLQWGERKRTRERGRRGEREKDQGKEEENGEGGEKNKF